MGVTEGSATAAGLRQWAITGIEPSGVGRIGEDRASSPPPYPPSRNIMWLSDYREQVRSYDCGPATMQMIDGAHDHDVQTQQDWASCDDGDLCTDRDGATAIGNIVRLTNEWTGWDDYVGPYVTVNLANKSAGYYFNVHKTHIGIGHGAPVIEHVKLYDDFFDYLDHDHGGHFQVGRGYNTVNGMINIFEPYDERDWSSGNHTGQPQSVSYEEMFDANHQYADEDSPGLATIGL